MAARLEIDGHTATAPRPWLICPGHGAGAVCFDGLVQAARGALPADTSILHFPPRPGLVLNPLLASAAGFVFREGPVLGHFSRVLRRHGIPACVDPVLWEFAREECGSGGPVAGRLTCGEPAGSGTGGNDGADAARFETALAAWPLAIPVVDLGSGRVQGPGTKLPAQLGVKALAVNALAAEGYPGAPAVIATDVDGGGERRAALRSLVAGSFPRFGERTGPVLMVRGSPHFAGAAPRIGSGLVPTRVATTPDELEAIVAEQESCWRRVRAAGLAGRLSLLLQERIPAPVRGILVTAMPWDPCRAGMAAELTTVGEGGASDRLTCLDIVDGTGSGVRPVGCRSDGDIVRGSDGDGRGALCRVVADADRLRRRCGLELEIEFVLRADGRHGLVQFRPLLRGIPGAAR